ncbi:NAD-dependent succinate-semialdehyde dehydrogenase [Parvularcula flava]|uniref:Succinate-semialdehyde dehydrogenase n=1 Tax=Aquisalinus luteolus TaxID=1566827 RepID=A0A8J3A8A5_9PROT|nr:NAD-dependent succinate-semialdehyde dehydrogenase [Aquisalinus luteolus]NHK28352.1 NAD-dependent succinate-semialdehyde dehydrogenase [Aquisalinus luteolus]GGH98217.1 succinate-semialdehyde dehydrogenase [Aquisalinus luteolus]
MPIQTLNPATGKVEKTFDELSDADVDKAIARSVSGFHAMRGLSFADRATLMMRAADILEDRQETYGRLLTTEMGKTFASAKAEVKKCAWACRFYAENAEEFLADRPIETKAQRSFARYLPIGPVLAVMPWNFPLWQCFRFAAPALMAGNTGLLKHASNVPQSALAIEEVFRDAGFPEGAFQTLLVGSGKVERILKDDRVRAATLTGSEPAGRAVAATAGDHIKKTVLELGGSDPFIVMPSADLDAALDAAVTGRTLNNGQSCIAAKRFIIHQDVYRDFRDGFVARFEALKVGDPMAEDTDIGPLAMAQTRDDLDKQVTESIAKGADCLTGGKVIDGDGFFYRPGILENIPEGAPAFAEELFGPVATLFSAASLSEAISLANTSRFGLGSAIFTQDEGEIEQAFNQLDAGGTFVNTITASDPRLPFGGVKASGYGRELAEDGIREFVNIKTCCVGSSS